MVFKRRAGKGCFTGGCSGCLLAAAALVAVVLVLALAVVLVDPLEPRPESRRLVRELPASSDREDAGAAPSREPMRLVVDLSKGAFTIEPGPPGSQLAIEADFDAATYELGERYDPESRRYELRFDARGGLLGLLRSRSTERNEVRLKIPRGYPVTITGKLTMGQSRVELGGLAVEEVDLRFGAGDHLLQFSEPLPRPAERVEVEGSFGQLEVELLGNASPRRARLEHSGGSFRADLEGDWRVDGDVEIECGFGDCRVLRPRGVRTVLERATVSLGEKTLSGDLGEAGAPDTGPTVRLWISSEAGELSID